MDENEVYYGPVQLSTKDLDNLEWAKSFMKTFETKESKGAQLNRLRQQKYF